MLVDSILPKCRRDVPSRAAQILLAVGFALALCLPPAALARTGAPHCEPAPPLNENLCDPNEPVPPPPPIEGKCDIEVFADFMKFSSGQGLRLPPPAIIDHGDGTYSYAAVEGRDRSTTEQRGALTWSYIGQARHSRNPKPMTSLDYVVEPPRTRSDEDKLLGMTRTDADGSMWRVIAVDMPTVRDQVARHDAESIEVARGLTIADPSRDVTAVEPVGARRSVTPNSWQFDDCDNSGRLFASQGDNHYYMNDDDRVSVSATSSTRRKAMVEIRVTTPRTQCPYDGNYVECLLAGETVDYCKAHVLNCVETPASSGTQCSGVILRSEWVLTAAHCVFDSNDNQIADSNIDVKRWDRVTPSVIGVESVFMDAGFSSPGFDPKDDWALLKLDTPLAAPFFDMDISGASDSTLNGLGSAVVNLAFPAFAPNCTPNFSGSFVSAMWSNTAGELGSVYSEKVNIKFDGGPGHSGSPVFFCPGGDGDNVCEGTEEGSVVAVWSGWNGFETTFVGAKGPSFRSTATTIMDNN